MAETGEQCPSCGRENVKVNELRVVNNKIRCNFCDPNATNAGAVTFDPPPDLPINVTIEPEHIMSQVANINPPDEAEAPTTIFDPLSISPWAEDTVNGLRFYDIIFGPMEPQPTDDKPTEAYQSFADNKVDLQRAFRATLAGYHQTKLARVEHLDERMNEAETLYRAVQSEVEEGKRQAVDLCRKSAREAATAAVESALAMEHEYTAHLYTAHTALSVPDADNDDDAEYVASVLGSVEDPRVREYISRTLGNPG